MTAIKRYALILMLLLACSASVLNAQQSQPQGANLPKVLPPSPATQNFMRYGEIPVDYSTGVPSISVPLYTLTSRQLSLPVSLSYHGSGIKVRDRASVVGLGWVLNTGGYISHTILGNSSGTPPTYKDAAAYKTARLATYNNYYSMTNWFNTVWGEINGGAKTQSDRYSYSLPNGESGVFRYDFKTGNVIKLPYTPTKIAPANINSYVTDARFALTDSKGNTYKFANNTLMTSPYTWYLTSITSADLSDTIRLTYKSLPNKYYLPNWSSALELSCFPQAANITGTTPQIDYIATQTPSNTIATGYDTYELLPDSIITSTTFAVFSVANDREDMNGGTGKFRVSGMKVYNRANGQLMRSFVFNNNGYFGSTANNNKRLKLSSVTSKASDDATVVETHTFAYEESVQLPPYPEDVSLTSTSKFQEDYWGYYNGKPSNTMVPREFTPATIPAYGNVQTSTLGVNSTYSTNRNPDSLYAKAAMLKEIVYPTGGKTVFDFEPNRADNAYSYPSGFTVPDYVGGFRIRSIRNYLEDGTAADYKYYQYAPGATRTITEDLFEYQQRQMIMYTGWAQGFESPVKYVPVNFPKTIISSVSFLPLTCENGPPVFYGSVTEFFGGPNSNAGKIVYGYQPPPPMNNTAELGFDVPVYLDPYMYDRGNYTPMLTGKIVYKRLSGGTYAPVKATINGYSTFLDTATYQMGLKVTRGTNYVSGDYPHDYTNYVDGLAKNTTFFDGPPNGQDEKDGAPFYLIPLDLKATQETQLLAQTTEIDYDPANPAKTMTKTVNLTYGSLAGYTLGSATHTEPTLKSAKNSKGELFISTYKYPADYPSTQPYSTMVSSNILSPVIEEASYKGSTSSSNFLQSVKTDYSFWDGGLPQTPITNRIYPRFVLGKKFSSSNPLDTLVKYKSYDDYGNMQEVSRAKGPSISYIWGYKKKYPVAEVKNATYAQVVTALTQSVINQLYNSNLTDAQVRSLIAPLRTSLPNAEVTIYTYKPLVGVSSTTDARGITNASYEYDNYQRLKDVKDKDGQIIKHYEYHYKQ